MNPRLGAAFLVLCTVAQAAAPTNVSTTRLADGETALTEGLRRDREALLALRNSIYSFGKSNIKSSWSTSSSANPCQPVWPSVSCQEGRVVAINLAGSGIRAANLPSALGNMDELKTLDLSGNDISGSLPDAWGKRTAFRSLQSLNLQDCSLSGALPRWNYQGAWPKLRSLSLAGNDLEGTLPISWASPARPLRHLVSLDLSSNYLGWNRTLNQFYALPDGPNSWGNASLTANPFPSLQVLNLADNAFTGSLPDWGKQNAYPILKTLDLQDNRLSGALRASWGAFGAFPRLESLYLSGNMLGNPDAPGGLPSSWAGSAGRKPFPFLKTMVLFPGNDNVCSWLDGSVQSGAAFKVEGEDGEEYGPGNSMPCPEPPGDNPPASAALTLAVGGTLRMSWTNSTAYPGFYCGFRTVLTKGTAQVRTDVFVVRPVTTPYLQVEGSTFSNVTAIVPEPGKVYKLSVATVNCNGGESSPQTATYSA